jgi:hypothetical protein
VGLHFAPGKLPPVHAFWSVTMYDMPAQLLLANPLSRYLINSPMLPNLKHDADGGLTLLVQSEIPGKDKESNCAPCAERALLPDHAPLLAERRSRGGQVDCAAVKSSMARRIGGTCNVDCFGVGIGQYNMAEHTH